MAKKAAAFTRYLLLGLEHAHPALQPGELLALFGRESLSLPSSIWLWRTQCRSDSTEQPRSLATSLIVPPERAGRTASARNSGGYGGLVLPPNVDSFPGPRPSLQVSTKAGQLQELFELIHRDFDQGVSKRAIARKLQTYLKPAFLVLDEVGYLPLSRAEGNMVFQLVSRRYEKGSIILTSNKTFSEMGQVFADQVLATAILDRLLHHAEVLSIKGPFYRLKDRMIERVEEGGADKRAS